MKRDVADGYCRDIERLVNAESICPKDGLKCCSVCKDCGKRFCECAPNSCERELGLGCSATRDGDCPKGWSR